MTTDRTIEATTDGTRIHVRIFPPFPGAAPLALDEAEELARQVLAVLPPLRAAAVAREALALDAVRAAEAQHGARAGADHETEPSAERIAARQQLAALAALHVRGGRLTFTRLDGDDIQIDELRESTLHRTWTGTLADWEEALLEAVRERDAG